MSFGFQHNQYGIRDIGIPCEVPDNPFAELAYYLGCVAKCLDIREELGKLADYTQYRWFTLDDKKRLVSLAILLSPDKLIDKCWFPSADIDRLNDFYELTRMQNNIMFTSSIQIGMQSRRVAKIMLFQQRWLNNYYTQPLRTAIRIINYEG